MANLLRDLPLELLPVIFQNLPKPQHLALICRVNKTFYDFAIPLLYTRAAIYSWQKEGKFKVIQLFDTLSHFPHLAKHVRHLEIRDFPKALSNIEVDLTDLVVHGLKNCINLYSITWTRDGSLNSEILEALQACGGLKELEINGHNEGNFDPKLLESVRDLKRVSLIMPSLPVIGTLGPWFSSSGCSLRSLTLICKSSPIVTDDVLESLANNLQHLDQLHITGCPKVTHQGIWAILSTNYAGIGSLGLEGVSPKFDIGTLSRKCSNKGSLNRLQSITLTVHQQLFSMNEWVGDVLDLISNSPLEKFQVYSTSASFELPITDTFWDRIIHMHGARLLRLSVHRMPISLTAIKEICTKCLHLEELFISVKPESLDHIGTCLAEAKCLRVIHINYPLEASLDLLPITLSPSGALEIVKKCSSTIGQFGCNSKVWQVGRTIEIDEHGNKIAHRMLCPYERVDIPEAFLVVRT